MIRSLGKTQYRTSPTVLEKVSGLTLPKLTALLKEREGRFWGRVHKTSDCWNWTGAHSSYGYGVFHVGAAKHRMFAHRVSYILEHGTIPDGLSLDHLCRNRSCVNPSHLEPVTSYENMRRGESTAARNARKTHCVHGHQFTTTNTYVYRGRRMCRECQRNLDRAYMQRKKKL